MRHFIWLCILLLPAFSHGYAGTILGHAEENYEETSGIITNTLGLVSSTTPALPCTVGSGTSSACHSNVLVLFDASNDAGGIITLKNSWKFVAKQLMPAMDSTATWIFSVYGDQGRINNVCPIFVTPASTGASAICDALDHVYNEIVGTEVFGKMELTTVANKLSQCIDQMCNLLILITENKDQSDIQSALSTFQSLSVDVVVINLGSGDFSPVPSLCPKQPLGEQNQKELVDGLLNAFCAKPIGPLTCHTNRPPTTAPPKPQYTTLPPGPGPALSTPPNVHNCPCYIYRSIDLVVFIDGSKNMGLDNFNQAKISTAGILSYLSIGQGAKQTRVGSTVYGNDAILPSRLSTFKTTRDMEMSFLALKFPNQGNSNIDSALNTVEKMFADPKEHRQNAQKVMVIHASNFGENSQYMQMVGYAQTFKKNNGTIIVILHGNDQGDAVTILETMASEGLFFIVGSRPDPSIIYEIFDICNAPADCSCKSENPFILHNKAFKWVFDGCNWKKKAAQRNTYTIFHLCFIVLSVLMYQMQLL